MKFGWQGRAAKWLKRASKRIERLDFDRTYVIGCDTYIRFYPNPGAGVRWGFHRCALSIWRGFEVFEMEFLIGKDGKLKTNERGELEYDWKVKYRSHNKCLPRVQWR